MTEHRLKIVGAGQLAPGEAITFEFERDGEAVPGFLLKHRAGLVAYVNRCPHWAVDLDMGDGRFYAEDVDRIYCKNHGALFRVNDGMCDWGPCSGKALEPFSVTLEDEDAWLDLPQKP